jgi:2-C-methyl-D-erythritol 4-phosphate cytidylyltransferase / 2-C-methyl-D-erythritol 2,4-cyclodiphosphate synthase
MSGTDPLDPVTRTLSLPTTPLSGKIFLLLAAAGSSTRFGDLKKELLPLEGKSVLQHALEAFLFARDLAGILITCPAGRIEDVRASIHPGLRADLNGRLRCGIGFIEGGATRQISVAKGLRELVLIAEKAGMDPNQAMVLIHDGARPWVTENIISVVILSVRTNAACIPLCDLPDSPKIISATGFIADHPERDLVKAAQTPQGFALGALAAAHAAAAKEKWSCTDDASIWSRYLGKVAYVSGDRMNRKITYREDLAVEEKGSPGNAHDTEAGRGEFRIGDARIGEGWDIHPLVPGRKLLLGGVHVEHDKGEAGHSDGDVLWHAIIDALLGATGQGDIGTHFPPSDNRWKDADSSRLAGIVADMLEKLGWSIVNIDSTVILERPKLLPYREALCANIAKTLGLAVESVSVKAKTYEGFGDVGSGNAVEARAVVMIVRAK